MESGNFGSNQVDGTRQRERLFEQLQVHLPAYVAQRFRDEWETFEQYAITNRASQVQGIFAEAIAQLKQAPSLVRQFLNAQVQPGETLVMPILPVVVRRQIPIIVSRAPGGKIRITIPLLSCTDHAIKVAFRAIATQRVNYTMLRSQNADRLAHITAHLEKPRNQYLMYQGSINAANYIAMAATGELWNEPFHQDLEISELVPEDTTS